MNTHKSRSWYRRAVKVMPGGVNSPVRAFGSVGMLPVFVREGKGSTLIDVDGNRYIDYVMSWGPLILGHAHPQVLAAVRQAASRGLSFGAATSGEVEFAELLTRAFPSMEMVRLVNSGTEAVMSAVRLARAATGRDMILKFSGGYHGHTDSLLVKAGSGAATCGVATSKGIPRDLARQTIVVPYNDTARFTRAVQRFRARLAAVIIEPVCGNMGVVLPGPEFLMAVQSLTRRHGSMLIFDEVITGFRACFGGAQHIFNMKPDITCLGKIIGGGMPIGAYGASRALMKLVAPLGGMYQAGTLAGNPLAVACGLKTLHILRELDYNTIDCRARRLEKGLEEAGRQAGAQCTVNRFGSLLTLFFNGRPVRDFAAASRSDLAQYARFFRDMLRQGVYLPPSQFEAWFLSFSHTDQDIARTLEAARQAFRSARKGTRKGVHV